MTVKRGIWTVVIAAIIGIFGSVGGSYVMTWKNTEIGRLDNIRQDKEIEKQEKEIKQQRGEISNIKAKHPDRYEVNELIKGIKEDYKDDLNKIYDQLQLINRKL